MSLDTTKKTESPRAAVTALEVGGDSVKERPRSHTWFFRKRGLVGALCFLPASGVVVFSRPWLAHDSPADHLLEGAGWFFFVAYLFVRLWATIYVGGRKETELVTEGPYSLCRNPLYLGSFCWAVAVALLLHSLLLLAALSVVACVYVWRVIPSEESALRSRFGPLFDDYTRSTSMIFPRFTGYRSAGVVAVNVAGLRRELKRLLTSSLLLLAASALCHLRGQPWWPHLFTLP